MQTDFRRFAFKRGKYLWIAVSLLTAVFLLSSLTSWITWDEIISFWSGQLDPLIGLITLVVAFLVWWGEARQDWLDQLPGKLTAVFTFDDRVVMRCERANLVSESDIRGMVQQLGRQMNGNRDLRFNLPMIQVAKRERDKDPVSGTVRHWVVEIPLLAVPEIMKDAGTDTILVWTPPFHNKPYWVTPEP